VVDAVSNGGGGRVNCRRAHRSVPTSIGLSSVGRIRKVCCRRQPCRPIGSVTFPGVAVAVPSARWIWVSSWVGTIPNALAYRAVRASTSDTSDPIVRPCSRPATFDGQAKSVASMCNLCGFGRSVCVSGDEKSLRLKNASLPHDDRCTSENR